MGLGGKMCLDSLEQIAVVQDVIQEAVVGTWTEVIDRAGLK